MITEFVVIYLEFELQGVHKRTNKKRDHEISSTVASQLWGLLEFRRVAFMRSIWSPLRWLTLIVQGRSSLYLCLSYTVNLVNADKNL